MPAQPDHLDRPKALLHLVRHGQSTWNVERRLQGQTAHPPLTDRGRDDARRAAGTLAALIASEPAVIYSSDLVRARQTADIIAAALGCGSITPSDALREQHVGALQGQLTRDLRSAPVPPGVDISEVRWGGGESIADVHRRLRAFFVDELDRHLDELADHLNVTRHVVLVTHGDTLRVARALLTGRTHRQVDWDVVTNGAVITLPYDRSLLQ